MKVTPSQLRANIYRIVDQVAETGVPVEIVRRHRRLKIVPAGSAKASRLERLKARPRALVGDPEGLVHLDWSKG